VSGAGGKSYVCFGCTDFANNARTMAYHKWACGEGRYQSQPPIIDELCICDDDGAVDDYVDPATDNVCWYDENVPESLDFLGVIVLGITGLRSSTFSREVADGFIEGSVLQRGRLRGKSLGFDVILLATSCEGMAYGEEWLRSLLEEGGCNSSSCGSCGGKELTVRISCPAPGSTDSGLHTWQSVGLVDGFTPSDPDYRSRASCCTIKRGTFTMQSESPYSFSPSGVLICEATADPEGYVRNYDWMNDCTTCQEDCCDKCGFDALCTCYTPEPIVPLALEDTCFCTPLAKIVHSCCTADLPGGYDTAFKIDIYSGTDWSNDSYKRIGMRNLTIKLYDNPLSLPCITDDESYQDWCNRTAPCTELQVAYVPEDSTLTIDGRTNRIMLRCNGRCIPYDHVVTNVSGSVFPLVTRCQPLMIVTEFDLFGSQVMPLDTGVTPSSVTVESYLRFRN
jgi:hypothetical protein